MRRVTDVVEDYVSITNVDEKKYYAGMRYFRPFIIAQIGSYEYTAMPVGSGFFEIRGRTKKSVISQLLTLCFEVYEFDTVQEMCEYIYDCLK